MLYLTSDGLNVPILAAVFAVLLVLGLLYLYIRHAPLEHDQMIRTCPNCRPHRFQDRVYGYRKRIFNATEKGWRCTVCGREELR